VQYLFDPAKRTANLKKHGLDFNDASTVIEGGQTVTFEDQRFNYGETRFITLGQLAHRVVVIVTSETEDKIRIISMRKATRHEQAIFYQHLA
jgi:uncharacterized protein